jgi:hypothetical protein
MKVLLALLALAPHAHASGLLATCHDAFDAGASDIRVTYEDTKLSDDEFGYRLTAAIAINGERDEPAAPETFVRNVQILDVKSLWMNQPLTLLFGDSAQGVFTNPVWLQFNNRSEAYLGIHNTVHVLKCQVPGPRG